MFLAGGTKLWIWREEINLAGKRSHLGRSAAEFWTSSWSDLWIIRQNLKGCESESCGSIIHSSEGFYDVAAWFRDASKWLQGDNLLRHWLANSIDQVNESRDFTNNHDSTAHLSPRVGLTVGGTRRTRVKEEKRVSLSDCQYLAEKTQLQGRV